MPVRNSHFETIFNNIVDAVIVIGAAGVIDNATPAAERLFGYGATKLTGHNMSELLSEPVPSAEHMIGSCREVVCKRADGTSFPAEFTVGEGDNEAGRFLVGTIRDLTSSTRDQQASASDAQMRMIFDHSLVATALADEHGRLVDVNPAYLAMSGCARDELMDVALTDLTDAAERPALEQQFKQALDGEEIQFKHRGVRKDGEWRTGVMRLTSLPFPTEGSRRVLVQFIDETDRLEAERQLRENRERLADISRLNVLGEIAAGIAHEVNQPLGAIGNYAEACRIRLGEDAPPQVLGLLEKIGEQAQRAGEVIRRLRAAQKAQDEEAGAIDVNILIEDAIELAGLDAGFVSVSIVPSPGKDVPPVYADETALKQVLLNLLRNAVEATTEAKGSRVEVRTAHSARIDSEPGVLISIVDQGTGVSKEVEPHIMHPFFTTKQSGMGVGLAICQSLLRDNQAKLWFENNENSTGATFHILLPLADQPEGTVRTAANPSAEPTDTTDTEES